MMAGRPVAARAILTAFSTASAPLFTSSVFLANVPGVISVSRRASSIYGGGAATSAPRGGDRLAPWSVAGTEAGGPVATGVRPRSPAPCQAQLAPRPHPPLAPP